MGLFLLKVQIHKNVTVLGDSLIIISKVQQAPSICDIANEGLIDRIRHLSTHSENIRFYHILWDQTAKANQMANWGVNLVMEQLEK